MTMRLPLATLAFVLSASAATAQPPGGPPRGGVFLSPMGEPFRSTDPTHDNVGDWFAAADADHDGALTLAEFQADAARFYRLLDTNRDGEIDPAELTRYETEVAPEVQVGIQMGAGTGTFGRRGRRGRGEWGDESGEGRLRIGRGGLDPGLEGAGRYAFLNIPEPVIAADADLNRGVSLKEFLAAAAQRFAMLDANRDGRLTRDELPPLPQRHQGKFKRDKKAPKTRTIGIPIPD
jgi:hypothetical protein